MQVVNALVKGIPIVKPSFFSDYFECLRTKQPLPDPNNYTPILKESAVNPNEISLKIMGARRSIFEGKRFVFASEGQLRKFAAAIVYGGGTVTHDPTTITDDDIIVTPNPAETCSILFEEVVRQAER